MAKIMIVDDEPSIRAIEELVLTLEKYEVIETKSADEAWKRIQTEIPDVILLDVMMPGMTPRNFLENLSKDKKFAKVKVILVTSILGAKEVAKGMKRVTSVIEKPFDNKKLLAALQKALK
jgi:CheY-like chemotaxis protein